MPGNRRCPKCGSGHPPEPRDSISRSASQFTGINPPKPLHPDSGTTTIRLTGIPFRWHAPPHEIAETPCCPIIAFPCFTAVSPRSNRGSVSRRPATSNHPATGSARDDRISFHHSCPLQTLHPQEGIQKTRCRRPESNSACLHILEGRAHGGHSPSARVQNETTPGRREAGAKDRHQDPRHRRDTAACPIAGSVCIGDSRSPESARSDFRPFGFVPFPA